MIEIKQGKSSVSITGSGSVVDVMAAYANVSRAVGDVVYKMTGIKELTDDLMGHAWEIARDEVFGEEGDDT